MTNINRNIYMRGLNGVDGDQAVYCTTHSGKTIFVRGDRCDGNWKYMSMSIPKRNPAAIRAAALYAGFARTQDAYVDLECATGVSAYTLALADWFGGPKVLQLDLDGWTGEIGQTIRVKARDNILVAAVTVVIRDPQRNFLEMGEAVQTEDGGPWWHYTTQTRVAMSPFPTVAAIIQDLPGNRDAFVIS
ncbi:MAG TPA: hypothetical protein VK897_13850 [Anaerolineales bacterium]|nr:hypothetical protein [Anaerolineales bacterium]